MTDLSCQNLTLQVTLPNHAITPVIASVMQLIVSAIEEGKTHGLLRDRNGLCIGQWDLEPDTYLVPPSEKGGDA